MKTHFKGKSVLEHLKEARKKGHLASKEHHGIEAAGHLIGGADSAKETAMVILLIWIVSMSLHLSSTLTYHLIALVITGLFFWKVGRSACLGWARLERINNLIQEEKNEIQNNRDEEKSELTEMYQAKGFSEPLLSKVIDVLMADDNKLLGIMLEEELGVSLESYEHPLKQAAGTAIGIFLAASIAIASVLISPTLGIFIAAPLIIALASILMARIESINALHATVWNLAITFLSAACTHFLTQLVV